MIIKLTVAVHSCHVFALKKWDHQHSKLWGQEKEWTVFEWKKFLRSVAERWIKKKILTLAGQSQRCLHLKNFKCLQRDSNPWPLRCQCGTLTNWPMKPLTCEQVNLLGYWVPVKRMMSERNVCEVSELVRALHQHRRGHGFESLWRHLNVLRCTYGTTHTIQNSSYSPME